jgi:CRP-like cAMP-binding protein
MNSAPDLGRWGNRLLAALPRETLAMLERDLTQVSLSQGVVCFDVGDQNDRVYFPATGMISLLIATKDESRFAGALINPFTNRKQELNVCWFQRLTFLIKINC